MADEAQVKLLREQGVEAWNEWRKGNPEIRPDLRGADLADRFLRFANLSCADLTSSILMRAVLTEADLTGADLSLADLRWANVTGADLSDASVRQADLSGGCFCGARLIETDLSAAHLRQSDLSGADLAGSFLLATTFADMDLSQVAGLDAVIHRGPSSIGIDTVYRSGANIPEVFLRGAGVPEPFIAQMKSLVAAMSPIEFYSCFISYSSKDQEFAERLHADLRGKNVRCWFALENLKIGDKLRPSFDEAIRVHDKLMVLLSEHSVKSPWVEKEVETAFEKERQQNRTVLFPIRLDDAVMKTDEAWAADIRRTRHIGDFRNWKDHDSYKKAFDRLLRDLKA